MISVASFEGGELLTTKHQQLLEYIEQLPLGSKISVRQMARTMGVSEGTAYRAIKEAEARGLVSAMPRVGTVRIEVKEEHNIQRLTFAEVVNIVDGAVLGGRAGLHKALSKFVIGAMKIESMARYIEANSLLIVGDREEAQRLALSRGAGVLITGGFDASASVRQLADETESPLISSSYDSFTIATLINRAVYDRMIKKEIIRAEDVMARDAYCLKIGDSVASWLALYRKSGHGHFPVVDQQQRVVGIITGRDVAGVSPDTPVEKVMTKKPHTLSPQDSLASIAHQMVWYGVEMMPVVEDKKLLGVVTRQDVLKAMQYMHRQPHVQMTHSEIILSQFSHYMRGDKAVLRGSMPPAATERGTVSPGALLTGMKEAAVALLRQQRFQDIAIDTVNICFLHPGPMEQELVIEAALIDIGHQVGKVDITVSSGEQVVCRAMAALQSLDG